MRIRVNGCMLALLTLLFSAGSAGAQQSTGTITGRVTERETQAPIAGATVEAVTSANRAAASAVTDADGQYRLNNVPAGSYTVVITMVGFQVQRISNVRVVAGETSIAGAGLMTEAFLLNPVVVTASKAPEKALDAPAHVEVVQEREIAERPTTTPVDHLRSVAGVDVITSGIQSTNVVARGFNNIFSGALHTLTDYRAARIPSLHVNFLHFVPQTSDDFGRMEVVLGPGAALYGPNTANGVLHLLTKSPLDDQGTTLAFAGGERSMMHFTGRTAQKLSNNFGFKVSGQYLSADEWQAIDTVEVAARALATSNFAAFAAQQPLDPKTGAPYPAAVLQERARLVGLRDYDTKRWSGDVRADLRATDKLTFVGSAGLTNATGLELTGIGAGQTKDWRYSYGQLRATQGTWFAQTYVNMSDAGDTYLLRSGGPIVDKSKVWATQLQHSAKLGAKQDFTYGADYIRTMPETDRSINGRREDTDNYNEFGAYLQSTSRLLSKLDVVLAGRYDKHSRLEDPVWSPRAALVFKPTQDHNVRLTYNRAFSTPTSLNLFLDIDAGPLGALGPFGFRAHAYAPGNEGIQFRNAQGQLGVSSPFRGNPRTFEPATAANIYQLQVNALQAAAAARGQPVPTALLNYMRVVLPADPAFATLNLHQLDPIANVRTEFDAATFADIPGIEESTTSTFEVGYKGILGDKLLIAVDAWTSKHKNFTSPLITGTPLILMNPTALAGFLVPRLTPVILASTPGITPAQAQAQATTIALTMAQLPGGVISSPTLQGSVPELLVTYVNYGELDISGFDVAFTALLSPKWQLGVTGSLISDDHFDIPLRGDTQFVALNAPTKKGSAHLTYRDIASGINGEVRVRYNNEFPANSAGYVGLSCVTGDPGTGPCVDSFTLLDVTAGYRLPFRGASLQLSIQNLLDEKYQSFVGTPEIGRMAILRLRYEM